MRGEMAKEGGPLRTLLIALVTFAMALAALVGLVGCTSDEDIDPAIEAAISELGISFEADGDADATDPADDVTTGVDPGKATDKSRVDQSQDTPASSDDKLTVERDGWYTSKEEVALYIHTYGRLPGNFISKTKARDAGWVSSKGNLDEVLPGRSIGGSKFYNDEGLLPDAPGRTWTECDINYHGGFRGSERIVFSNDGLIFYTDDHYQSYEQLY